MKHNRVFSQNGSILILSIWVLSFLSLLAALVGMTIRQRVSLVSRLEDRSQLRLMASAGVKKAIALLRRDLEQNNGVYTQAGKAARHNNPKDFQSISFPRGVVDVSHVYYDKGLNQQIKGFGLSDEEGRLNINSADRFEMMRLINEAAMGVEEDAQRLADNIIDWRQFGHSSPIGAVLESSSGHEKKSANFETLDELLLVEGMTSFIYEKIIPFVTVFGDGVVNINTASYEVLRALGFDEDSSRKIIALRRGPDAIESTADDHVFAKTFDVASEVLSVSELEISQIKLIDQINKAGKIKTNSFNYRIAADARLDHKRSSMAVICVYNLPLQRIIYWREK